MKMMHSKGFTLIELMVTIAILAIIAMMAVPSFNNMIENQNLKKSTSDLVAQLNYARSQAVLERKVVEVRLNTTVEDLTEADRTEVLRKNLFVWAPEGGAILQAGSPTTISYLLNGGIQNFESSIQDQVFVICNASGDKSNNLSVTLMGTTQVVEGTC